MNNTTMGAVLALSALLAISACDSGDDSSTGTGGMMSSGDSHCAELCDVSGMLNCPGDDASTCVADCEQQLTAFPSCSAQMQAFYDCAYAQPVESWECEADTGESNIKVDFCKAELTALENCVTAALAGS